MTSGDKKIFLLLTVLMPVNYFLPALWSGIFQSQTSFASELYWGGVVGLVVVDLMWILFLIGAIDALKKNK